MVDPENPDQDYEGGSVTFNLTNTEGFTDNFTVRCEAIDSRSKANVTWWIGNNSFRNN